VWIFAGGLPPNDFLKKIGIKFGMQDTTRVASQESKQAERSRREFAAQPARNEEGLLVNPG
jgi:hypothetical protein